MNRKKQREIKKLLNDVKSLEDKIRKTKKDNRAKINEKIVLYVLETIKYIYPYIISSSIIISSFKLLGGGYPLYMDNLKKIHFYYLNINGDNFRLEERYDTLAKYNFSDESSPFNIIVKTPWKNKDNYYSRDVYEYEAKAKQYEVVNYINKKDYNSLKKILKIEKQYEEYTKTIDEQNDYIIETNSIFYDKKDRLYVKESIFKNLTISISEFLLFLLFLYLIENNREYDWDDYTCELGITKDDCKLVSTKDLSEELNNIKNKILELKRGK